MKQFTGKTVFPGVAFGKIFIYAKPDLTPDTSACTDSDAEWQAFQAALKTADEQLGVLYEKTKSDINEENADIIDIQRQMLQDGDFLDAVQSFIHDDKNRAAYAVQRAGKHFYDVFDAIEDPYMHARAPDIADMARRVTAILLGKNLETTLTEPSIVIAEDLSPSDTLALDRSLIRAFVTRKGSLTSHSAILSRILKIPSLVQSNLELDEGLNRKRAAVDGHKGILYVEPDAATTTELERRQKLDAEEAAALEGLRGLPSVTRGGRKIELAANIGGIGDMDAVIANDAEAIGLFRSEFLYLGRDDYPSEEEQFKAYKQVTEAMGGKRVVVRTLDIGADKKADYLGLDKEDNPALGLRAIRVCFQRPEMFKTQLRALYRASAFGKVAIMFPMIASVWEFKKCKEFAAEVRAELKAKNIPFKDDVELGMMVETPAAAICAADFAKEADFFSVGTNDLTQYTLALDRMNAHLDPFLDTHHPALLKELEMIARTAREAGIWAGICGELGADPSMTERFIDWGYTELSVSPPLILGLRKKIRDMA